MDEPGLHSFLRVKRKNVRIVQDNAEKIWDLFGARLYEDPVDEKNVSNSQSGAVMLRVDRDNLQGEQSQSLTDLTAQLQQYVDAVCGWERDGDDSSYDSDFEEASSSHADVSRTVSDTLAAEYAEYVSSDALAERLDADLAASAPDAAGAAGYAARVDFGLKLGYAESLVQAALRKLGPAPAQNELLEELVKLGAKRTSRLVDAAVAASEESERPTATLRPIVIDGSNVAMSHGNKEVFSCRGIKICVDWFRARGHRDVTVFVPKWRKEASRLENPISEQEVLTELERERTLVFTPSRLVGGKRMVCYDDRYILRLAADVDGVVVSNDNYRDLAQEKPEFRKVVEERILMYSFVNDRFMPPEDPLGRSGPTLEVFLRRAGKLPSCPYAKKCTYGNKCKFHHPERATPHKSVTDRLLENAQRHMQARGGCPAHKTVSLPLPAEAEGPRKQPLSRTRSTTPMAGPDDPTPLHPSLDPVACFRTPPPGYGPGWCRPPAEAGLPPEGNLHRKLARQLTLNPSSDPRLVRLHHRPVARHASDSAPPPPPPWERGHACVARISSAPPLVWPPPPGPSPGPGHHGDARRRLHYHLAAIFPEEQVTKAMQLYPDESNPQKICAAILAMFPKT